MKHFLLGRASVNREAYILDVCSNKKVLHIGFADWPITKERIKTSSWLHSKITDVSTLCVGIDSNSEAVALLKNEYGVENIHCQNAESIGFSEEINFDVIVAGEIIEHLSNPGLFIESVKGYMGADTKLIITTVNAFCFRKILQVARNIESVHPDHVCYYSHTTLETIMKRYGFELKESYSYAIPNKKPLLPYLVESVAKLVSPNWCEGIVHAYMLKK